MLASALDTRGASSVPSTIVSAAIDMSLRIDPSLAWIYQGTAERERSAMDLKE